MYCFLLTNKKNFSFETHNISNSKNSIFGYWNDKIKKETEWKCEFGNDLQEIVKQR